MSALTSIFPPNSPVPSRRGEPTWEVAHNFPWQGEWTEAAYLALSETRFVELSNGCLEFLPMPILLHQLIVKYLAALLETHVTLHGGGTVAFAPVPIRLWAGKYREPDIFYLKPERKFDPRRHLDGADLVMEIVSPGAESRIRDLEEKREDYAKAGIGEYWIVDPELRQITVLTLDGTTYREHGVFGADATATSVMFPGFAVSVEATFRAGEPAV